MAESWSFRSATLNHAIFNAVVRFNKYRLPDSFAPGAEWPILLTSLRLGLISEICGEFHEIGGEFLEIIEDRLLKEPVSSLGHSAKFTIDVLVKHLEDAGFAVTYRRLQAADGAIEGLGLFFATRAPA